MDDIVDDEDALAAHQSGIIAIQIEGLLLGGGDRLDIDRNDIVHIELDRLSGQNIGIIAMLTGHFVGQRNTLGFGCDQQIVFGGTLEKLGGTGTGQVGVAEDDEACDLQLVADGADGQVAFQTCDGHSVIHLYRSL